jgi:hypothetical protein
MTKRTEKTGGTQGANTEATALGRLLAPLVDGMTTTRRQLLAWVQSAGLVALEAVWAAAGGFERLHLGEDVLVIGGTRARSQSACC